MNTKVQNENIDSNNDAIEEVQPLADGASEDEQAEYNAKLESSNKQLYARLKKAEGFVQKDGKWVKAETPTQEKPKPTIDNTSELTQADVFTLVRANIDEEDIPEIQDYAKLKKITIAEALKTTFVKSILADKNEQRKVAEGTNVGGARRGNARLSDEALVANARAGKYPESDEDMRRLSRIKLGIK